MAHDRYLGLPAVAGWSRKALFHNIRHSFWDRISGWNSKLLSKAGKGVLNKSVLQSLPTYAMSCFKLLDHLLHDMKKAMRNFWWHSRGDKRVHWVALEMCRPLVKGGMGFRNLTAFNIEMLKKQGWRIISQLIPTHPSFKGQIFPALFFLGGTGWIPTISHMEKCSISEGGAEGGVRGAYIGQPLEGNDHSAETEQKGGSFD
ncbi:UNVERIFIED_CONTAM: hypothetical protein Slati_0396000 [Sesamum latifolium]|uniref:Uncharacterized protein n=1 Tax=Sesamum latifolium TaxID=2727402 RepID=A0AAW2XVK7_9LAMI